MRTVTTHPGDTVVRLAVRHLGDASRWRELVTINRLEPPYVVDDPAPYRAQGRRVLGPHEPLLVPLTPGEAGALSQRENEQNVYGVDLGWNDRERNLLFDGERPGIDRGLANLTKALYRRLITRPGELPYHPGYGCMVYQHLGQPATNWRAELAALDVKTALLADPRVRAVRCQASHTPTGELRITAEVTPVPPSETTLRLDVTIGANASARVDL